MQTERYATRDKAYSAWHRMPSVKRFVGTERACRLSMIDLDGALYVEHDDQTSEPLALVETALDVGQASKAATVTARLAAKAGIPAYVVLYQVGLHPNPADKRYPDIRAFRVQRVWPSPERGWRILTPTEWAAALLQIRDWAALRFDIQASNDDRY